MRGCRAIAVTAAAIILLAAPAQAKDDLVIGISQFPSNFNPLINAMTAKSYILGMTRRHITVYDTRWKLICDLCTELPSLGAAPRYETTADGKPGIAVTYTLKPEFEWGDGKPVTTKDVLFTWEVGRNAKSGAGNFELFSRITSIDVKDDKTFTLHVNKRTCDYDGINDFEILPEHLERKNFAEPVEYVNRSAYETDTQPRPLVRSLPGQAGRHRLPCRAGAEPALEGEEARLQAHHGARHREHRRHGGEPAVGLDRLYRGRDRDDARPGAGLREAARQALPGAVQAEPDLRAHRPEPRQPDPCRPPRAPGAAARHRPQDHHREAVRRAPAGRPRVDPPARQRLQQGHPQVRLRPGTGEGAARGSRLDGDARRHPPQRQGERCSSTS
jgi:hypothetical protein